MGIELVADNLCAGLQHPRDLGHGRGDIDMVQDIDEHRGIKAVVGIGQGLGGHGGEGDIHPAAPCAGLGDGEAFGREIAGRHARAQLGDTDRIVAEPAAQHQHRLARQIAGEQAVIHRPIGIPRPPRGADDDVVGHWTQRLLGSIRGVFAMIFELALLTSREDGAGHGPQINRPGQGRLARVGLLCRNGSARAARLTCPSI